MSEELKASDLNMDAIDQTCMILQIDDDGCRLMRDAAITVYGEKDKKTKKKRAPSQYNLFIGSCIKERPEGQPVQEAMKSCAIKWKKKKRGV